MTMEAIFAWTEEGPEGEGVIATMLPFLEGTRPSSRRRCRPLQEAQVLQQQMRHLASAPDRPRPGAPRAPAVMRCHDGEGQNLPAGVLVSSLERVAVLLRRAVLEGPLLPPLQALWCNRGSQGGHMIHEFDCAECGRHIINVGGTSPFNLCAVCIAMPGWYNDPKLVEVLDPGSSGQRLTPEAP